ncbi:hypothetical protein BH11PSE11_BH11PSE11_24220 [soil metagenome]
MDTYIMAWTLGVPAVRGLLISIREGNANGQGTKCLEKVFKLLAKSKAPNDSPAVPAGS